MGISETFSSPLYEGAGVRSPSVPQPWDLAIGGRTFMIDWDAKQYRHQSIPLTKVQSDDSGEVGEQSINPDAAWRRSASSWARGAGQPFFDLDATTAATASERARFNRSKGVNVWEKGELTLLHDVVQVAPCNIAVPLGDYLYHFGGQYRDLPPTRSVLLDDGTYGPAVSLTGSGAGPWLSAVSDGSTIWFTNGSAVYSTTDGTYASYNTLDCDLLGWAKNRLMAAHDNAIYNITSGTPPTALFTHPNTSWRWVGFANGLSKIYAAGYAGDKSLIYKIAVTDDATELDAPIVAGELPDGEIVRCVYGYLGFVLIGTDKGVRFAIANSAGDLTLGGLIDTPGPVRCFEGQDRFVWFGIDSFDDDSTGLGRLDLSQILDGQRPAWASDLMVDTPTWSGRTVTSVVTHNNRRVFAVSGAAYQETDTHVARGWVESGWITFGVPEAKLATFVDVRHNPLNAGEGAHETWLRTDDGSAWIQLGAHTDGTGEIYSAAQRSGERFEVSLVLRAGLNGETPTITRWTLQAQPAPGNDTRRFVYLPLLLATKYVVGDRSMPGDPLTDREYVELLRATGEIVTLTEIDRQWQIVIEDFEHSYEKPATGRRAIDGTTLVKAKVI